MTRPFEHKDFQLGILGGGQLGKMLCQQTSKWGLHTAVLDKSRNFPAAEVCSRFVEGDFTDHDDVLQFGRNMDVVTIEIETINTRALRDLISEGVVVNPAPQVIDTIKDKGQQKQFYHDHHLPTSPFTLFSEKSAIESAIKRRELSYPFVVKSRTDGYDGRGVCIIRNDQDFEGCFDTASLVEPKLDIELEVAVIVARNARGEIRSFPPVGMEFHPEANLVEVLFCPTGTGPSTEQEAIQIAQSVAEEFDICGLLAVEMFVTSDGNILINEVAPRPHNSGHHTIEACAVSQFEQHLRAVMDLPLADTTLRSPAAMVNLLGAEGHTGDPVYSQIESCLRMHDVHVHLYGKPQTRPFRKMGHATVLASRLEQAIEKANFVRDTIRIIT